MLELLLFFVGLIIGLGAGVFVGMKLMQAIQARKKQGEEQEYKRLWSEAVSLMGFSGQLTPEQIARITPSAPSQPQSALPALPGFSDDRRDVEIARAKKGLPPADNLKGMFSDDVRKVHQARIKHGTAI